jgi:hypothetical protein
VPAREAGTILANRDSVARSGWRLRGCGCGCGRSDSMFVRMSRGRRWPMGRRARNGASRSTLGCEDAPGDWNTAGQR